MLIDLAATAEVFHTRPGSHMPTSQSTDTARPGRCAVRAFAPGYGAAIMKPPEMSQARRSPGSAGVAVAV